MDNCTGMILLGPSALQVDWVRRLRVPYVIVDAAASEASWPSECNSGLFILEESIVAYDEEFVRAVLIRLGVTSVAALSLTERHLLTSARLNGLLGVPDNPVEVVERTVDKNLMRLRLSETRWAVPAAIVRDADELCAFGMAHETDFVVSKPVSGVGSTGVRRVSLQGVSTRVEFPMYVEAPLHGPEFSVEILSSEGLHILLGVTEQMKGASGGSLEFVQTGHIHPSSTEARSSIVDCAVGVLDALGVREGLSHTEVIVTGAGPFPVETHTRNGGDRIVDMLRLSRGVDMIKMAICQKASLPWRHLVVPSRDQVCMISFIYPPGGVVSRVSGVAIAKMSEGVVDVSIDAKVGELIKPNFSYSDRRGAVLVSGPSEVACQSRMVRALSYVEVQVESSAVEGESEAPEV